MLGMCRTSLRRLKRVCGRGSRLAVPLPRLDVQRAGWEGYRGAEDWPKRGARRRKGTPAPLYRVRRARKRRQPRTFRDAPRHVTPICPATDCASRAMDSATSGLNTGRV